MNELKVTIPAQRTWLLALRSCIGACGSIAGLSIDTIGDLRIAIDESFDLLTHQAREISSITMLCKVNDECISISLTGKRTECAQNCIPQDPEIAELIIGTLVTEIKLESDSCGTHTVNFSLPVGGECYECR